MYYVCFIGLALRDPEAQTKNCLMFIGTRWMWSSTRHVFQSVIVFCRFHSHNATSHMQQFFVLLSTAIHDLLHLLNYLEEFSNTIHAPSPNTVNCSGLCMCAMPLDLWEREKDCFTKLFLSTCPVKSLFGMHGSFMTSCIYQTTWTQLNSNFVKCKILFQIQKRILKHFHWSQN